MTRLPAAVLPPLCTLLVIASCDRVPERAVDHVEIDHAAMGHGDAPAQRTSPRLDPDADGNPRYDPRRPPEGVTGARADRRILVVEQGSEFPTIASAVRAAAPGTRIVVRPGLYREPTIRVDRPVTIQGEGYPVIDGEKERGLFLVEADGVRITGFELRDVGVAYVEDRAAIRVSGARDCELDHNRIHGGFFAVYLAEATDCRVTDNEIVGKGSTETNSGNGIHAWHSKRIVVEGNTVHGHRDGIYFEFVDEGQVSHNHVTGSIRYGLHFMFSDGGRYEENVFSDNGAGVAVMYTTDVTMRRNQFVSNRGSAAFGILLKEIGDSEIVDNLFADNSVGLFAEGFDRTLVQGNRFVRNGRAIRLLSNSTGSRFEGNDFFGNTFDVTTNGRRVRSTFVGNHWDEYRGYDRDEDGIGDVPHRPVRLFALVVERAPVTTIMLRSFFSTVLDWTEYLVPSLTPANLTDTAPAMRSVAAGAPEGTDA